MFSHFRYFYLILFGLIVLLFAGCMGEVKKSEIEDLDYFGSSLPTVIPQPLEMQLLESPGFLVSEKTQIEVDSKAPGALNAARFLQEWLKGSLEGSPEINTSEKIKPFQNNIVFISGKGKEIPGREGYGLEVNSRGIIIRANDPEGFFYGVQTFRQLSLDITEDKTKKLSGWIIPAVKISDAPRFEWRGFMLDSSRHFQSKEFILHFLEVMAYSKLNKFHWHLIDAQGWRLEIEQYPDLTKFYNEPGFYSKDDVKEILAKAKSLHIQVIPEIEMPAHNGCVLEAYPNLKCDGWAYCAGKEETFEFLESVLCEVMEIFDSPVIHVGGDERPENTWKTCPLCQKRIKDEQLKNEHALQNWFMKRISDFLNSKGRRVISWAVTESDPYNPTDIDDLGNNAIIQNWHDGTVFAAHQGWEVVNSINGYVYFDYPEFPGMEKPAWMPLLNLERVYQYDPIPVNLEPEYHHLILGGEACLWTELVNENQVYESVFPRLLALSECVWSPAEGKDYPEFLNRVKKQENRFNLMGVPFAIPPESYSDAVW